MDGRLVVAPPPPGTTAQLLAAIAGAGRRPDAERVADAHLAGLSNDPLAIARFLHGEPASRAPASADATRANIAAIFASTAKPAPRDAPATGQAKRSLAAKLRRGSGQAASPLGTVAFEPSTDDIAQALDHVNGDVEAAIGGLMVLAMVILGALVSATAVWILG